MYAFNGVYDGGILIFNTCQAVERMFKKNAKSIEQTDDIPRALVNFGGSSILFKEANSAQKKFEKFLNNGCTGENFKHMENLVRRVTLDQLEKLQAQKSEEESKESFKFNLTELTVDTIGYAILKKTFGPPCVNLGENIPIYIEGKIQPCSVPMAIRLTYQQSL